jgi:hypothetical protein
MIFEYGLISMSLTQSYPQQSVIKYRATTHLKGDPIVGATVMPFDETLLHEIAETVFESERYPALKQLQQPGVKQAIEYQVAAEIVIHYKQIKQRAQRPIVQHLNALLGY